LGAVSSGLPTPILPLLAYFRNWTSGEVNESMMRDYHVSSPKLIYAKSFVIIFTKALVVKIELCYRSSCGSPFIRFALSGLGCDAT